MYTDTILFMLSGLCLLIAIFASIYLLVSRKRSLIYRSVLQQETNFFDALTATAKLTSTAKVSSVPVNAAAFAQSYADEEAETELLQKDYPATQLANGLMDADKTELLQDMLPTEPLMADVPATEKVVYFDASALEGRYVLEEEILGGGMSRIFLARSSKLGNRWIVKYISHKNGALANEENILKQLNHISLPKIVDIFHDDSGVYLVENYIEGVTLDTVLDGHSPLNQILIQEWAEQITRVLSYLHNMKPSPIYHFDLKPSNIMVTHDNRLVLIDFGISKQLGQVGGAIGVTYKYAAPEQLKYHIDTNNMELLESRFGNLSEERFQWQPDARTDIYSLGVMLFELSVGQIPTIQNVHLLKDSVSQELCKIIKKCLELKPQDRYQNAQDLLVDTQKIKGLKMKMVKALFMRKFAAGTTAFAMAISIGSLGGGYYMYGQENLALLDVEPSLITLSLQQSTELKIEKQLPDGTVVLLEPQRIRWNFDYNDIAQIDGNRIVGINTGQAELSGQYRKKEISLQVNVVPPLDGMVDIVQIYQPGHVLQLFAGTMERKHNDGTLDDAEFVSPESIDIADDGTIYITDAGLLRKISGNEVESIDFEPGFITSRIVRCRDKDIYILTHAWKDDDGAYYGLIRIGEDGVEDLYIADAAYTAIEDFIITNGLIYYIERNEGAERTYLKMLNPQDVEDIQTLCELSSGSMALSSDDAGRLYIANIESGVIQVYQNGKMRFFAGTENERAFIDGSSALFYMPQRLRYEAGHLYVWDFNTLRRIEVVNGVAGACITLAGEASPEFSLELSATRQAAGSAILPNSRLMDFALFKDVILLTDPKRGVVWRVE